MAAQVKIYKQKHNVGYYLLHCELYFSVRVGWASQKTYEPSRKCLSEWLPGLSGGRTD